MRAETAVTVVFSLFYFLLFSSFSISPNGSNVWAVCLGPLFRPSLFFFVLPFFSPLFPLLFSPFFIIFLSPFLFRGRIMGKY
ncbi:hypothetical protein LY76DRAFT_419630 [Colletotrichum caudatum]|nr:hypothetical protein LY76DRAFT_419630 [Colletotrichum caudatum]